MLETKNTLKAETLERLQDLVQINLDSQNGFKEVAEKVEDASLARMFREYAAERGAQASELKTLVETNGEEATDSGSVAAAAHRAWIDLKAAFTSGGSHALLAEAERGEDQIKHKYEDVLKETAGSAVNDVLQRQYAAVKSSHDRIKALRDAAKT
ncbi:MAG: PA2169 family four-helix-bundle protein [Planctomycetota bacterium]|nr:PA2169 family four-helix-bundle protein [Planctomycetota bacterium]